MNEPIATVPSYYLRCPCCLNALHWAVLESSNYLLQCEADHCLMKNDPHCGETLQEAVESMNRGTRSVEGSLA